MSLSHLSDWCLPLTLIPISVAKSNCLCGSRGLVAMGGDWCPKGCGFKSQHHVLDVHIFFLKIVMFFVNEKEAGCGPLSKNVFVNSFILLERLKLQSRFLIQLIPTHPWSFLSPMRWRLVLAQLLCLWQSPADYWNISHMFDYLV